MPEFASPSETTEVRSTMGMGLQVRQKQDGAERTGPGIPLWGTPQTLAQAERVGPKSCAAHRLAPPWYFYDSLVKRFSSKGLMSGS